MMSAETKQTRAAKFTQRNRLNYVATVLGLSAMAFGLFWLFFDVVFNGNVVYHYFFNYSGSVFNGYFSVD